IPDAFRNRVQLYTRDARGKGQETQRLRHKELRIVVNQQRVFRKQLLPSPRRATRKAARLLSLPGRGGVGRTLLALRFGNCTQHALCNVQKKRNSSCLVSWSSQERRQNDPTQP